jgi:hypothetical protein
MNTIENVWEQKEKINKLCRVSLDIFNGREQPLVVVGACRLHMTTKFEHIS